MTWTELHDACEHQDVQRILQRVNLHSEEVVEVDEHGWTPLHILCWSSPSSASIEALLKACLQTSSDQDAIGNTPLHVACSRPETDKHVVQVLLDACPAAASMPNHEGLMPLHMACRHAPNNSGVIGLLIDSYPYALRARIKMGTVAPRRKSDSRSDPLEQSKPTDHSGSLYPTGGMASLDLRFSGTATQIRDGAYPLHMAVESNAPLDVIEMMVKEAEEVLLLTNKFGETPLQVALKNKAMDDVVEVLLKYAPKAIYMSDSIQGNTPVHTAASVGCSARVAKGLLETNQEAIRQTNAQGLTPLELAISSGTCADGVIRLFQISNENRAS